ncbi:hypothetical protein [Bradyrhizobium liaoningense]
MAGTSWATRCGHRVLNQPIDHGDRIEHLRPDRRCRIRLRRPAFLSRFGHFAPAGLVRAANVQPRDAVFGGLVLVDELDPEARHPGEALLIGIAALLCPGAIAADFVLKGAALDQKPLVSRRAALDIGPQSGLEHGTQSFQIGSFDQLLYP